MKKLLTLILVTVFALSLAAPALAYTTTAPSTGGAAPVSLDIYLVDYQSGLFGGMISQPASNRGYAKNEIVAAVAALTVPANVDTYGEGYRLLQLGGDGVALNVMDNMVNGSYALTHSVPASGGIAFNSAFTYTDDLFEHEIGASGSVNYIPVSKSKATYNFLFFGKVLKDSAEMFVKLSRNATWTTSAALSSATQAYPGNGVTTTAALDLGSDYTVLQYSNGNFAILKQYDFKAGTPAGAYFEIEVDSKNVTKGLLMNYQGATYRIETTQSGDMLFLSTSGTGAIVEANSLTYRMLLANYEQIFEDDLGFSAYNKGNLLRQKDFQAIANNIDIEETVLIEPWVPQVTVPDVTITKPPKTGVSASMLGFTFIAIAALAAATLKKVRA